MRVLVDAHMVGQEETGNETYIANLLRSLSTIPGVECGAATGAPKAQSTDLGGAQIVPLIPPGDWARLLHTLPRACRTWRADVLHVTYVGPLDLPCPLVVTVHDISFKRYPEFFSPKDRLLFATLLPITLRRAAAVITVSEFARNEILDQYPYLRGRLHVTREAASTLFRPVGARESLREVRSRFGVGPDFVLAVGNLQPRKNLLRLIRAFALLRDRVAPTQLVIVGKARWQSSAIYDEVRHLGLARDVVLTGYVPTADLVRLYNAARAFVYPSLYEGFGLPVLEAMACGTPVVTTNTSSLPEVAGDAALLVDPHDTEGMAEAIERVLIDSELSRTLSEAGLRQASRFTWHRTATETLAVYEQVAQSHDDSSRARTHR